MFTGLAALVADLGFPSAIIHKRNISDAHLNSAFCAGLAVGVGLAGALALLAPALAAFYDQPELATITWAMSASFVLGALSQVQGALLRKRLQIPRLALTQLGATTAAGAAGIAAAYAGAGVFSLVIQALGGMLLSATALWTLAGWRPGLRLDRAALAELTGFGGPVVLFTFIAYALRTVDRLLIGRVVGLEPLGIYVKSYDLMMLPLSVVAAGVGRVLFPAMAALQQDRAAAAAIYLRSARAVSFFTFPAMVGLFVAAPVFVQRLFGPAWLEMVPLLQILAWVGLIESIGTLNGNIYLSTGSTTLQLKVGSVFGLSGLTAVCLGLPWGIGGVAWGYALYATAALYPSLRIAGGLIGVSFATIVRKVQGTLVCSLVMGLVVWGGRSAAVLGFSDGARLALQVVLGAVAYPLALWLGRVEALQDIRLLARSRRVS